MAERIYTRGERGGLEPLEEEPFSTEDELQALIAEHPELLDGEQIRPGDPRRWVLITREQGIADTPNAADRWSVDLLIVDQDAVPTLAEVKRGSNREIRRTIVGQLLEYAAHAAQTWTAEKLCQRFKESANAQGRDPDGVLAELLQMDEEPDADDFWKKVDGFWVNVATNLTARRLRLLFIADEIPDELEQVVKFLNEQMPRIEVLAVEIKQFRGKSSQTLVPRVIGRTTASSTTGTAGPRRKLTRESFLDELPSDRARDAAIRLLEVAQENGALLAWRSNTVSIRVRVRAEVWPRPITVAWLCTRDTISGGGLNIRDFAFGAIIFDSDLPEELRATLDRWADQFAGDTFAEASESGEGTKVGMVGYDDAARHIDLLADRLAKVLSELKAL